MSDVLVLNKSYIPIHIITWQKAISLMYTNSAEAIDKNYQSYTLDQWIRNNDEDGLRKIHSVNMEIKIPAVIKLLGSNHLPKHCVKFTRQNIFQRDNYSCQYCGRRFHRQNLTKDHLIPKSKGGKNTWDNIVTACLSCNKKKADKDLEHSGLHLTKKPTEPSWMMIVHKKLSEGDNRSEWCNFLKHVS